jgi:hypothetical protein
MAFEPKIHSRPSQLAIGNEPLEDRLFYLWYLFSLPAYHHKVVLYGKIYRPLDRLL